MTIRKEVQVGILILVSLGVLYWGLNFLKGIDVFKKERAFYAVYDRVEGLGVSNPVQINGHKVGIVREVGFLPDNSGKIVVKFEMDEGVIDLPKYTIANISSLDLLGSKTIDLILGSEVGLFHEPGDTLRSSVEGSLTEEVNKQILPIKKKAEDLLSSMDTLVGVMQAILNKEARDNLSASFQSIKNALLTFERVALRTDTMVYSEKEKLARIMTNFQSISNNLRNNNENVTMILDNLAYITDSIAMSNVTTAINNAGIAFRHAAEMMEKISRGEGSLGMLVNNDSLYIHLDNASRDLDKLLVDLDQHPGRYVHFSLFGRRDKEQKQRERELKKQKRKNN